MFLLIQKLYIPDSLLIYLADLQSYSSLWTPTHHPHKQHSSKPPIVDHMDMALYASWTHGSALTIETAQNLSLINPRGWGANMSVAAGKSSWFHIAIPTPVIVANKRANIRKFFLMFNAEGGKIHEVQVYDGAFLVQKFENQDLRGDHRGQLDGYNTFLLAQPHVVAWGIGVSFLFQADIGFDSQIPPSKMILAAAGGDFMV